MELQNQNKRAALSLQTERLQLRILDEHSAPLVLSYYMRNRAFHQPWFPTRDDPVFTLRQQQMSLASEQADFLAGRAVPFWLFHQDYPDRIIGRFAFMQIIHGSLRSASLAWHLDQDWQGQGLAHEAGLAAIPCLFADLGLHRIEAFILPCNTRSIALARRLGFELEGLSPRYLMINQVWEDHLRYVRLSDGPLWPSGQPGLPGQEAAGRS